MKSTVIKADSSGNIQDFSQIKRVNLDLSKIEPTAISNCITTMQSNAEQIESIVLCSSKLNSLDLMKILEPILVDRCFIRLVSLDLSHCSVSDAILSTLCEYLNPFTGGYNIRTLNITRCKLGVKGTNALINSLFANVSIQELIITGNNSTDECIPALITALTKYENNLKIVGLSANQITSKGMTS